MICNALENASDGLIKISLFTKKIVAPKMFRPNFCVLNLGGKYILSSDITFIKPIKYLFQIFPSVGHSFRAIETYFHKVVLNFITDSFNYDEKNAKDYQQLRSGLIEDISSWFK